MTTRDGAPKVRRGKGSAAVTSGRFPPLTVTTPALLMNGSDSKFRELVTAFLDIGAQLRELRLFLAGSMGVSEPQYRIVLAVAQLQHDSGVNISAVAEYLGVSPNFVTMEVRKLYHADYVAKLPDPADGRGVLLKLSDKGLAAYVATISHIQLVNDTLYGNLSQHQFMQLLEMCKRVVANGEKALDLARQTIAASPPPVEGPRLARTRVRRARPPAAD